MKTERLYQTDVYKKETDAILLELAEKDGLFELVFDQTVFFPTGGGQPCDLGEIDGRRVTDVHERGDGAVVHVVEREGSPFSVNEKFEEGGSYHMTIDWRRRFTNMQRHLGEHIFSGAFYNLYGYANKGFHMGENYIAVDIDTGGKELTDDMIRDAEFVANEVIWNDEPVRTDFFRDANAASVLPVRKKISAEGEISVVTVGDRTCPSDCVACCGTHPTSAGSVGLIKVYKHEPNKGMTRIYFDCGRLALERCSQDMELLARITSRFSAGSDDIWEKLDTKDERESELRRQLAALSGHLRDKAVSKLSEEMKEQEGEKLFFYRFDPIDINDGVKLGFSAMDEVRKSGGEDRPILLVAVHRPMKTVLLFSNGGIDCSEIIKNAAIPSGGKGGGRKDNARAVFGSVEDIHKFADILKKTEL